MMNKIYLFLIKCLHITYILKHRRIENCIAYNVIPILPHFKTIFMFVMALKHTS